MRGIEIAILINDGTIPGATPPAQRWWSRAPTHPPNASPQLLDALGLLQHLLGMLSTRPPYAFPANRIEPGHPPYIEPWSDGSRQGRSGGSNASRMPLGKG